MTASTKTLDEGQAVRRTIPTPGFLTQQLPDDTVNPLMNRPEQKAFLATALSIQGSVTPRVIPRVLTTAAYASVVVYTCSLFPHVSLPVTPFEYSGAILALILVLRVNAGQDRWWEARKLWGGVVNQSRNLGVVAASYSGASSDDLAIFLRWVATWPHVMRESLRQERVLREASLLLGEAEAQKIRKARHMPSYTGLRIAKMLESFRKSGMEPLSFMRAETERSLLIDNIGACERILTTRMPYVLAIKTRRFIFLYLLLLPFALVDQFQWLTPIILALASYPLFSLDEIGAELQNPFSPRNLSHLPLETICSRIEGDVLSMQNIAEEK